MTRGGPAGWRTSNRRLDPRIHGFGCDPGFDKMSPAPMRVGVGIVSYNTRSALRTCLTTLIDQADVEAVVVVDNGSDDGSPEMVRRDFPGVLTRSLPENPGYGAAANVIVDELGTDVVVLLNADVRLGPGAIRGLAEVLAAKPRAGIVGPRLVGPDGALQRSCFADPSLAETFWGESGLHAHRPVGGGDALHAFDHRSARTVPWVLGAALAIRRTAFDEIGGFDPDFFLYYEEVDLCRRLRRAGWEVWFTPEVTVVHEGGASIGQRHTFGQLTHYRSLHHYHVKHGTAPVPALRLMVGAIMTARLARDGVRSRMVGRHTSRAAVKSSMSAWRAVLCEAVRGWPPSKPPRRGVGPGAGRLDWLALLPEVRDRPTILWLGRASPADDAEIARHLAASHVLHEMKAGLAVDVLVVRADVPDAMIDGALASVSSGGVAYVERHQRVRGPSTPRGLRARMRRAGLEPGHQHWLLPDQEAPTRFVPLDDPCALRWYLDHLFTAPNAAVTLASRLLRSVPALLQVVAPSHSIVAARGVVPRSSMIASCPAGAGVSADARLLLLTSGYDVGSRSVVVPFGPSGPECVVKMSSRPAVNETTRREFAALEGLRTALPPSLATTVPQPIESFEWRGRFVSVETLFSGDTAQARLRRSSSTADQIALLDDVVGWGTEMHRSTAIVTPWPGEYERRIAPMFARFGQEFEPSEAVWMMFDRMIERCREVGDVPVTTVRRHVDLGPWNIILTHDGLAVIDWETTSNRPEDGRGLPLCDLSYFVKYWLHIVTGSTGISDELSLFPFAPSTGPEHATMVAAARRALRRYCRSLEVDERIIGVLLLYNWVEHAVNGADRGRVIGTRRDMLPSAVAYVNALADHVDVLLDDPLRFVSEPDDH